MAARKSLGSRMKIYEQAETGRVFLPGLPVVARLDGRSFHSFTRSLERPYDKRLSDLMVQVTVYLVGEACARIGYTQSDEISLVFYSDGVESQIFFDGSVFKMTSVLASMASVKFKALLPSFIPEKKNGLPVFDCRVWNVPSREEAVNTLIWRELDATRNSVSMAAQAYYPHEQLLGRDNSELQEMLFEKGINWNDYPSFFKRGVYVQRRRVKRRFTIEELDSLPPQHNARVNPNLEVDRTEIRVVEMPPLARVKNREQVVFEGAEPIPRSA
jgi:tRNA(His) guanylyltransferase